MKNFNYVNFLCVAAICCFGAFQQSNADEVFSGLNAPGNVVYNWTNGMRTGPGVSFTIAQDYGLNDTMTFFSDGFVDYIPSGGAALNGAGVGLSPVNVGQAATRVDPSGRVLNNGGLALWNSDFGAVRMFIPDASHGLGSATPPTAVSTTRTVADIFSEVSNFSGLTAGQEFHILPVDSNTANSGSYQVDVSIQSIPEPSAGILATLALGAIGVMRRRRKA